MATEKQSDAIGWEIIRQACPWAGLLFGLAIVLKDLIEPVEFTYVLLTVLVAWTVAMMPSWRQQGFTSKWAGPMSGLVVIVTAILLKLVMEW